MDQTDYRIIEELQQNARITISQLAKKVSLSAPSVSERILKLEEKGVLKGYSARLDIDQLGYKIICFVSVNVKRQKEDEFIRFCKKKSEILECHLVSGESSILLKVGVPSIARLESFLEEFHIYGETHSHIVLKELFKDKVINKPLL